MGVDALRETLPEYAKDISLNLSSVMMQVELSEVQAWGTALACAIIVLGVMRLSTQLPMMRAKNYRRLN